MCVCVHVLCMVCVERVQLVGADSSLPYGFWALNLDHPAWEQVHLPVEPSCWPPCHLFPDGATLFFIPISNIWGFHFLYKCCQSLLLSVYPSGCEMMPHGFVKEWNCLNFSLLSTETLKSLSIFILLYSPFSPCLPWDLSLVPLLENYFMFLLCKSHRFW